MENKFHFKETAELSKAFCILSENLGLDVDFKILLKAKKIKDPGGKLKYIDNLVAELNNKIYQVATEISTLLAGIGPLNHSLVQEELGQELMNIVKIRLGCISLNKKIKINHIFRIFLKQLFSCFTNNEVRQKMAKKDFFYPEPFLNFRVILNGIELMESMAALNSGNASLIKNKTKAISQLHIIYLAKSRPKLAELVLNHFLKLIYNNPWLINEKPRIVRSICEFYYYTEFSIGNEQVADEVSRISLSCLETLMASDERFSIQKNDVVAHMDFTKTIGYLANLLILARIQNGSEKILLLSGGGHLPGNPFLLEKVQESSRIIKLSRGKSRLALKAFQPWPVVTNLNLDGKKYNWYEGLWKACQGRKFTPLEWKEEELKKVESWLAEIGFVGLGRFITLHIRDPNFYFGQAHEAKYHGDRNADISTYTFLVKSLLVKGYSIVVVGGEKSNRLKFNDPKFYDYAHSDRKSPILDIYLMSRCSLFIGTNSGPFAVPGLYGTPALITNFTPIGNSLGFPNYFYLPKKIWDKKRRTFLSFCQQLEEPLAYVQQINSVNRNYILKENTSAELRAAGLWVDEFLSGRYRPSASWREYFNNPMIKRFPRQISIPDFYFQMNPGYFRGGERTSESIEIP
jgi:putative glycosyltransferase (TIGR04372 family)